jgi:hypothetical protein
MEKIALKNTQQGSPNTYELSRGEKRQLIESSGAYRQINAQQELPLYITGQWQKVGTAYDFPFSILAHEFVLYFAQASGEAMRFRVPSGTYNENFTAPSGAGVVVITPIEPVEITTVRMSVQNLETVPSASLPVLSSWCFTYSLE